MKKSVFLLILASAAILWGCKPTPVNISNVITNLSISNRNVVADGTTVIYLSAQLNNQADAGKQSVIFTASAGTFPGAKDTTITQAAVYSNGALVATVAWQVPQQAVTVHFKATSAAPSPHQNFVLYDSVKVSSSVPSQIQLATSAITIKPAWGSEILLTATLKNSQNNNVSTGYKVNFGGFYPDGTSVGGTYRAVRDTTDMTSTAIAYYSVGTVTGSFYVKCSVAGTPVVRDSVLINVSQ